MNSVIIEIQSGEVVAPFVDPFYIRHQSGGRARPIDTFFLAMMEDELVGCVRYCVEHETAMLRTMMIDERYRRNGIGQQLLQAFAKFLDQHQIKSVYCLPYAHLERFYATIGFIRIEPKDAPSFLRERLAQYSQSEKQYILMKRL